MIQGFKYIIVSLLLAYSLSAGATSVAVIDVDKILQNYPVVQALDAKLHQQFAPRATKITAEQQALQTKIDRLKRDSTIMTDLQRSQSEADIAKDKNSLDLEQAQFNQDVDEAQHQAMSKVLSKINQAVIKIAKAKGYEIVLQKDRTIYINDSVDISNNVLSVLKAGN